tara:strand:- start:64 stop:465 length:402 start_codon:yes stop_codon:yes gene_type:complete
MKHNVLSAFDALRPGVSYQVEPPFGYEDISIMTSVPHKSFVDTSTLTMPSETEINNKIAELHAAEPMRLLREERDYRLLQTDWTQNPDVPTETKTKWQAYRQALRDLPSTSDPKLNAGYHLDQTSVTWPSKPS